MEKSSTTTGSEGLFLTDDLEGRLGPEDLVEPIKKPPPIVLGANLNSLFVGPDDPEEEAIAKPERLRACVTIELDVVDAINGPKRTETSTVDGRLDAFSFGKGWLVTIVDVDEKKAFAMGRAFALYELVSRKIVYAVVDGSRIMLTGDLDFTIGYGYSGCSFTVTADEGHYVGA